MTRALVEYEKAPNGEFRPIVVYQATGDHIEARGDLCNPRAVWKLANYTGMYTPSPGAEGLPATWEDWIGLALDKFANGYTSWAVEVEPAATIDDLYARYAEDIEAASPASTWPSKALTVETDPVATPDRPELVEMTVGLVVHVGRETDRRLYGVVMDPMARLTEPMAIRPRSGRTASRAGHLWRRTLPLGEAGMDERSDTRDTIAGIS